MLVVGSVDPINMVHSPDQSPTGSLNRDSDKLEINLG